MEEEDDMLPTSPFWLQNHRPHSRHLRRSYSLILTSTSLIILLLVTALAFIFIVVPTLHSFTSNIFKPHSVKKSWDSLNLVLVLFAIVCGFLSKNNNATENQTETRTKTENQTPRYYYQDGRSSSFSSNAPFNRLRSFNSYPDLRLESPWIATDERWRFYDDTHLLRYHRPGPEAEGEELDVETVATVTSVKVATAPPQPLPKASLSSPSPASPTSRKAVRRNAKRTSVEKPESNDLSSENSQQQPVTAPPPSTSPRPQPPSRKPVRRNAKRRTPIEKPENNDASAENSQQQPATPPPPQPSRKSVRRNAKRPYQSETIEKPESNDLSAENLPPQPSTPPPPPPPPPEIKLVHSKKKRGTATKEFLTSLRGMKKQRQRSVENFDTILNSQPSPLTSQPPPPPPPSVFHNLFFSKKEKHKTLISNKIERSFALEDKVKITGNESSLIPIPPPPPPPPFKLPAWKFRVHGDFVRIDSIGSSSRSVSPDLDEVVESPISQQEEEEGSHCNNNSPFAPLCPPSPDVDTKANTFIERFRAGLRMEKMNSIKEKHGIGRSNLGLSSPNTQANEGTRPK